MRASSAFVGAALIVLGASCRARNEAHAFQPGQGRKPAPPPAPPMTAEQLGVLPSPTVPAMPAPESIPKSLEEARQKRRAYERLPPDGRFLRALRSLA
jgi:hypothetical protein